MCIRDRSYTYTSRSGELDGIVDKVGYDLIQTVTVTDNPAFRQMTVEENFHTRFGLHLHEAHDVLTQHVLSLIHIYGYYVTDANSIFADFLGKPASTFIGKTASSFSREAAPRLEYLLDIVNTGTHKEMCIRDRTNSLPSH